MIKQIIDILKTWIDPLLYLFDLHKLPKLGQGYSVKKEFDFINIKNSKEWRYILIHHSATVDGDVNDWDAIKKYHMSWRYQGNIITEKKAK